jgi:hypothetical protein
MSQVDRNLNRFVMGLVAGGLLVGLLLAFSRYLA